MENSTSSICTARNSHPSDSLVGELPDKSTRVIFTFDDGSKLFFNDQRKFGWVRLLPTLEVENLDFFKKVGPEPLGTDFTANDFITRLQRRKNSGTKAVLLDQTVVAGVGNIYADESLWAAKIHPETKVQNCTRNVLVQLYKELRAILRLAIEKGGSTDRNYVNHEVDKLFDEQRVQVDFTKRKAIYDRIQEIVWNDIPVFPFCTSTLPGAFNSTAVTGIFDGEASNREDFAHASPA